MQHRSFSLHKITNSHSFGFDPAEYSRFKYGDADAAKNFGTCLADGFIKQVLVHEKDTRQIVVISSPYSFIPTATFAMKNYFVFRLNRWLTENGLQVVQETKVHRTITYKDDYGELNAEQRMSLIGNDHFHIDAGFLKDKVLLFLDDIKITGSHERVIARMIQDYDLDNDIFMLYFAELVNSDIHPNIENYLNYHAVKSIFDLDKIINSKSFDINTRIVKYLLHYDHAGFKIFACNQQESFLNQLYDMALGNSYHTMEEYSANLNYVKYLISKNQNLIYHGN